MRLTVEFNSIAKRNISGVRLCEKCSKQEFLASPKRWDLCSSCVKKELYKNGTNKPPLNYKKISFFKYCENCLKSFEITSKYYENQRFCSVMCAGILNKDREPANKIWKSKTDRNKNYYEKIKENPEKWLALLVRNRAKKVLKTQINRKRVKNCNIGETEEMLGCTTEELKKHIEAQFQEGMSWDNWGTHGWHIDHIYPLSKVDLTDRSELLKATNYRNLRPMWSKDNRSKRDRVEVELEDVMKKGFAYEC